MRARAGKLRRVIEVQRSTDGVNAYGTPEMVWAKHLKLRAELVTQSMDEFLSNGGDQTKQVLVFRTRWVDDITTADRVSFKGEAHDIAGLIEIGTRAGLEIRCMTNGEAAL